MNTKELIPLERKLSTELIQREQLVIIENYIKKLSDELCRNTHGGDTCRIDNIINIGPNLYEVSLLVFVKLDRNMIRSYKLESMIYNFTFDEYRQRKIKSISHLR